MTVTATDLRKLVDFPEGKSDSDLQPFLDSANLVVTEDLAGKGLTVARLGQIELFLAAHYAVIAVEHGGLQSWTAGQAKENYKRISPTLQGLASTNFGQQALALDTSGTLSSKLSALKAKIEIGKLSYKEYWQT